MSPDDMNNLPDAQPIAIDSPDSIDAHVEPVAMDNPSPTSPPGPTIQSIVTEWLPDALPVRINNYQYIGCLAALYHATWKQQRPEDVFVTHKVVRDPVDARASVDVRDYIVALQWTVDGQTPSMLLHAYKSRAILVRDEYKFLLARIWEIIGEDGGVESGYVPKPEIDKKSDQTGLPGPPYNPYEGLQVEWSGEDEPPGVNISGTPGIGKSLFLLILLALRLLAQQPTVFQFKPGEFVVFHDDGVFHSHLVTEEFLFLPQNTWFLVDSNDDNILPPISFIQACNSSGRKLILAAPPRENRFSHTKKNMGFATLWMEPFTLEEYVVARTLQARKTPISEKQLETFFLLYGPSARDAYQNAKKPHVQKGMIENNIDGLIYGSVVSTLRDVNRGYFETKFSDHVLIARRLVGDATQFYVEFASRWVADMIYDAFARLDQEVGLQFYRQFLRTPRARSSAGSLLETFVLNAPAWRDMADTPYDDGQEVGSW